MGIRGLLLKCFGRSFGIMAQDATERQQADKIITPGMPQLVREVAADGAVLLENTVLPFNAGARVSVFGRTQIDYFCAGYGSGGDVNTPYKTGLLDGLCACEDIVVNPELADIYREWVAQNPAVHGDWGTWPRSHPEMNISDETVAKVAQFGDNAVVVIGRSSGEDRDCVLEQGSYYITDEELDLLGKVSSHFANTVVVLNIGCIIDMSWVSSFKLGAVLIAWQGGMESGNAIADILCGKVSPSGRLTDTIAKKYED